MKSSTLPKNACLLSTPDELSMGNQSSVILGSGNAMDVSGAITCKVQDPKSSSKLGTDMVLSERVLLNRPSSLLQGDVLQLEV